MEHASLGLGKMEPMALRPGETELAVLRSGEMEPVALGSGETFYNILLHPGKSAWALTDLLWVSLISIPDSSPRAYGGVEYSFGGFFEREDSEGLGLLFVAHGVSRRFPFVVIRPLRGIAMRFR